MPCGCNSICDNDCGANQICTGNVAVCSNDYSFTTVSIGDVILKSHLQELQTAIDNERIDGSRRFNASEPVYCSAHITGDLACTNNDFSAYGFSTIPDIPSAANYTETKHANNLVASGSGYGTIVTTDFISQDDDNSVDKLLSIITAADITDLQTKINETRNACVCDSHCNCDGSNCGCDAECPGDDPGYS